MADEFIIKDGALEKYTGPGGDVVIPDAVTGIGEEAFKDCISLTSVTIPDGMLIIGNAAFQGCSGLTSVKIPDDVYKIGKEAFESCENLETVIIPESVLSIGDMVPWRKDDSAFRNCPKITIVCQEGSFAQAYCDFFHLPFVFDYQFKAFHGVLPLGIDKLSSPFLADEEKPFVFISYSHKDRAPVLDIIKKLYESGWRIWYDEGLTVGDRYDEVLEQHVKNCSAFLLFITEHSQKSHYINENEIPWAIQYDKPIIKCILDKGVDVSVGDGRVLASAVPSAIEPALERVEDLSKGAPRIAKGISVLFDPAARTEASGNNIAYCVYSENTAAIARSILLEARNSGCSLYDAVERGKDIGKLQNCACLIVFLDRAFISDGRLMDLLIHAYHERRDIAICQMKDLDEKDLPDELVDLSKLHWLTCESDITKDMTTQLSRYLQKRGCRDSAILPGFSYEKTENGIVITRYTGMDSEPRIEQEYGGIPVTVIAERAFENCSSLKRIEIPLGVKEIKTDAFYGCINLLSITIPSSVSRINDCSFERCRSLVSLTLPDTIIEIGDRAFKDCTSLTSIRIPDGVTKIESRAFWGCKSLVSITIPESTTEIGDRVFENCTGLTSITIPNGVTKIGSNAFQGCTGLTSITIPDGVMVIEGSAFSGCTGLTSITIPDGVRKIESYAFQGCTSLTSVTIPDSVRNIGEKVFLDTVYYNDSANWENGVLYIGRHLIKADNSIQESYSIRIRTLTIADNSFKCCISLKSITIPDSVAIIGNNAFEYCTGLDSVTIPDSVTMIGRCAFGGCTGLNSITIPGSVTVIKSSAFQNCSGLNTVTIEDGVKEIEDDAFICCDSLTSVTIPDSVTKIGSGAFMFCSSLSSVTISDSITEIAPWVFAACPLLTFRGAKGSYAEKFANEKRIPFIPIR